MPCDCRRLLGGAQRRAVRPCAVRGTSASVLPSIRPLVACLPRLLPRNSWRMVEEPRPRCSVAATSRACSLGRASLLLVAASISQRCGTPLALCHAFVCAKPSTFSLAARTARHLATSLVEDSPHPAETVEAAPSLPQLLRIRHNYCRSHPRKAHNPPIPILTHQSWSEPPQVLATAPRFAEFTPTLVERWPSLAEIGPKPSRVGPGKVEFGPDARSLSTWPDVLPQPPQLESKSSRNGPNSCRIRPNLRQIEGLKSGASASLVVSQCLFVSRSCCASFWSVL